MTARETVERGFIGLGLERVERPEKLTRRALEWLERHFQNRKSKFKFEILGPVHTGARPIGREGRYFFAKARLGFSQQNWQDSPRGPQTQLKGGVDTTKGVPTCILGDSRKVVGGTYPLRGKRL